MPTQIIENFDLTTAKPLDSRFVVGPTSFYVNKDDINYKYSGLRVWDLNDNLPYVWTGTTWSNENSSGTVIVQGGGATSGYIPKFVGASPTNILIDSIIFDDGVNKIGIGTITPTERLEVAGNIKTTGIFNGNGSLITNINATNITTGTLAIGRLQYGSATQVLLGGVSSATWTNLSSVTVGNSTNVTITNDDSSTTDHYLTFVNSTSGNNSTKVNYVTLSSPSGTGGARFKPSTSQLLMSPYWQTPAAPALPSYSMFDNNKPPYSFHGDTDTGMYSPGANELAFSTGGNTRFVIGSSAIKSTVEVIIPAGASNNPSLYFSANSSTGFYRPSGNQIGISISSNKSLVLSASGTQHNYIFYSPNSSNNLNLSVSNAGIMNFSNTLSTSYYSFLINSTEKFRISNDGVSIGQYGTKIKRALFGYIVINIDGSGATVVSGSGFTLSMIGSIALAKVRVTFDNAFSSSSLVINVTQVSDVTTTTSYPSTWTSTYFDIRAVGYSGGTLGLHFSVFEV
jgi:hypothetical protein